MLPYKHRVSGNRREAETAEYGGFGKPGPEVFCVPVTELANREALRLQPSCSSPFVLSTGLPACPEL